jgi:hypothetical protein
MTLSAIETKTTVYSCRNFYQLVVADADTNDFQGKQQIKNLSEKVKWWLVVRFFISIFVPYFTILHNIISIIQLHGIYYSIFS